MGVASIGHSVISVHGNLSVAALSAMSLRTAVGSTSRSLVGAHGSVFTTVVASGSI